MRPDGDLLLMLRVRDNISFPLGRLVKIYIRKKYVSQSPLKWQISDQLFSFVCQRDIKLLS